MASLLFVPVSGVQLPAYGELYLNGNITPTDLPVIGTYYPVTTNWISGLFSRSTLQPVSGSIVCDTEGTYQVSCSSTHLNFGGVALQFEFALAIDGVVQASSSQRHTSQGANTSDNIAVTCLMALTPGNVVDFRVRCTSQIASITFIDVNFQLVRI